MLRLRRGFFYFKETGVPILFIKHGVKVALVFAVPVVILELSVPCAVGFVLINAHFSQLLLEIFQEPCYNTVELFKFE